MLLVMALEKARADHCGASTAESFSALSKAAAGLISRANGPARLPLLHSR